MQHPNRFMLGCALGCLTLMTAPPAMAVGIDCKIGRLLHEITNASFGNATTSWVGVRRVDGPQNAVAPRRVAKDQTVISLRVTPESRTRFFVAAKPFQFTSPWLLNMKHHFRAGQRLPIRGVVVNPDGERLFVTEIGTQTRLAVVREDGSLCNKVINPDPPPVFLVNEYEASEGGRLQFAESDWKAKEITVKVVYLGSWGGTSKYRELATVDGEVTSDVTREFDTEATRITVGGLTLTQHDPTASSVHVGTPDIPGRTGLDSHLFDLWQR